MKRILITGKNSYVGTNFRQWLAQWPDQYQVDAISVRDDSWKQHDFSQYDVVLHVAGIAHVSADPKLEKQYYRVNRDLAIEVAVKSKEGKVKQFIFMSSIIVYGDRVELINKETIPEPTDFYGKSKLQAEQGIASLEDTDFKVVLIRAPLIYGPLSKGNFIKLKNLVDYIPLFPNINNKRSMIYIDNMCEFIRLTIDYNREGICFPQNRDYVSTLDVIKIISGISNKKIYYTKVFNFIIRPLSSRLKLLKKVLGNKVYEKDLSSEFNWNYCVLDFKESVESTFEGERLE